MTTSTAPSFASETRPAESLKRGPAWKVLPPPLENGDRLSRREFERRYAARPRLKKVELIEGVVYMSSPVHLESHAEPHSQLITWLGTYQAATPGVRLADNATVRLDEDNEVQPDALLRTTFDAGGRAQVSADDYLEGAPELVVEIAASSAAIDLTDKLKIYRRNGVQEYIVWPVYDERVHWFRLHEGEYVALASDAQGLIRSQVFPGLWLNVPALLEENLATVLADLQKGLATDEHRMFVEQLRPKA
jgi:Uma2 family endonuclease